MTSAAQNRDIVVIGASAGGVDALSELVTGLPADLPAAVLVVLHTLPTYGGLLPEILTRRGPLRAVYGLHGDPVEPGHIYVAPPDNHLTVRAGHLQVLRGPKENGHRPSVDALFRSAAQAYGPRVIGVVLSGHLDCGTAGLMSIRARRGICVVQDPEDAAAPDMPRSAMSYVDVDHVVPVRDLGALLGRLTHDPAPPAPEGVRRDIAELEGDELGVSAEVVCPLCQGKMTETKIGRFGLLRCHVGHAFTEKAVLLQQAESLERALWAAVRALDESASLARRVGASAGGGWRERLLEKEEAQTRQAHVLRRMLEDGYQISGPDVAALAAGPREDQTND
ncbi:MAG TPA: chemotaxis protein CheB [Candidatus Polarisedimenticolaceae bacterium]|nr:chemotaxis protein CheB [Candidatus Polarisedimenticolaceae bacterium]